MLLVSVPLGLLSRQSTMNGLDARCQRHPRTTHVILSDGGRCLDVVDVEEKWVSPDLKIIVLDRYKNTTTNTGFCRARRCVAVSQDRFVDQGLLGHDRLRPGGRVHGFAVPEAHGGASRPELRAHISGGECCDAD
jgi:hypothetical protein